MLKSIALSLDAETLNGARVTASQFKKNQNEKPVSKFSFF
jgi:hypothetical protein